MKFPGFREFRNKGEAVIEDVVKYLSVDLIYILRELTNGLTKLSLNDNFESFESDVSIAAGQELEIRNELDAIPSKWIIINNSGNSYLIEKGTTEWTLDFVYLMNNGGSTASATILFLK